MALLWFEGFEGLGVTEGQANKDNIHDELRRIMSVTIEGDTAKPYLRPGALQGKSLAFQNVNTFAATTIRYHHPTNLVGTEFVIGFRFKTSDQFTSGLYAIMLLHHENPSGTQQLAIGLDASDNSIDLYRGGTIIDSSAGSIWVADEWFYIELKILLADGTGGSYEMKFNDTTIMSASGVDTLNTNTVGAQVFVWQGFDAAGNDLEAEESLIDDIYLLDTTGSVNNDFLGSNTTVVKKSPDADGTTNDFTPQSGVNNYEMVDENPASSSDYNDGAANGDIDEYSVQDIDESTIYGIAVETHVTVDNPGRNRKFRHRVRSGASVGNGSDLAVSGDLNKRTIFQVDPNTSAAWTKTAANAAEYGVEVRD